MSNDSEIAVKLTAQAGELQSGMAEAVSAIKSTTDQIAESLKHMSETAEESKGILEKMLSGEMFAIFAEVATVALEQVKRGFEDTVGAAEEFGLSNAKFAATMGTSETEAAGLSAALQGVGSSAGEFESIVSRLTVKVEANEKKFKDMGIATRDSNGALLTGKDLFDSAVTKMESLKAGTDQTAFAHEVFGKKAVDVYNILRAGQKSVDENVEIYKSFGLQLDGAGASSAATEDAMNKLRVTFQAAGIAVGQQFAPVLVDIVNTMSTVGVPVLNAMIATVKGLAVIFDGTASAVANAVRVMLAVLDTLWQSIKSGAKALWDALHGNFGAVADDLAEGASKVGAAWTKAIDGIKHDWEGTADVAEKLFGPKAAAGANPFTPPSGSGKFEPPTKGKKGPKDNSAEQEIQDEEKLALAKEKIEEATNAHRLAMGQESESAFLAQAVTAENATYQIKLEALNKELALGGQTKAQHQKLLDEMQLLSVEHEGALLKIKQEGETQQAALDKQSLADFLKSDDEKLKTYSASLADQVSVGKLSATEKDRLEIDFTQTVKREELARLDAHIATLTPGTKAYQAAVAERSALETKFTDDVKNKQKELAKDVEKDVKSWVGPMASSFTSAINSMIVEGKSFGDAMKELGKSLESALLTTFEKIAQNWLEMQITNAIVAKTSALANATTQITAEAAIAGAAAFADSASLGPVGLAAAPGVGAGAFAAGLSYIGLASAAGGMVVDRDQLVYTHKNEMILPANLSGGLQSMISGGGGGGGDTNLHYNPVINGGNNADLAQLLREQPGVLLAWLAQANRDGKLKARPGQ